MSRVLAPGGRLILRVDTLADSMRVLRRMNWLGNMRSTIWQLFGIGNTLWLEATGRQLAVKARGKMYGQHSPTWPRDGWLRRRLPRYGLSPIDAATMPSGSMPGLVHAIRMSSPV
jgi:hypothetical protein